MLTKVKVIVTGTENLHQRLDDEKGRNIASFTLFVIKPCLLHLVIR